MPTFRIIAFISSSQKDFMQFTRNHFSENDGAIAEGGLKNGKYEVKYLNGNTEVYVHVAKDDDIRGRIFSDYVITDNNNALDFKTDVVTTVKLRIR